MKPDLSIIIVNWKVRYLLEKCLDSIYAYAGKYNIEVVVIDNDSRDGTAEMVMVQYPEVIMIALPSNNGFAKANNLGIKRSSSDLVMLLNPDTEITAGFFDKIFDYFHKNPEVGVVGPQILNPDRTNQPSVRSFPTLLSQILILLKLRNIIKDKTPGLKNYLQFDFDYQQEQTVEQIMGAAMIIRRKILDEIGLLDEKFFIWFEEVDFCKRAHDAGIIIKYLPTAKIIHHSGASFDRAKILQKQLIFNKSLLHYFWKHKPFWHYLILLLLMPINLVLTLNYAFLAQKNTEE